MKSNLAKAGHENLIAGILSGGRSRRLGVDKGLIRWKGMTLVEHCMRNVSRLTSDIYVVTKNPGDYAGLGCPVLQDLFCIPTPLSGMVTIAPFVSAWLLLTASDTITTSALLFQELWASREPGKAVIAESEAGLEPFLGIYPAELLPMWEEAFRMKRFQLRKVLEKMPKVVLNVKGLEKRTGIEPLFLNLNRSEDLALLDTLPLHYDHP